MICKSYFKFFETVSPRIRWKILTLLEKGSMGVSEICEALGEEQSKISHNLRKLADCHFINFTQKGKRRIYSLNKETIAPLMKLVEKHVEKHCKSFCGREK